MTYLPSLTASEAARLIATKQVSSVELTRAHLDRIKLRNRIVGAWSSIDESYSLAQAAAADSMQPRSPLHGVPFGVKDVIDTVDFPTAFGTSIHKGRRPGRDASCVTKLRQAGAVLLGKLVTTEYAMFHPNETRHPLDTRRTPGGSSSGTAAAVADFQTPVAFGNQTAGSLIRPAAYCGVFGLKPTHGIVEQDGILPLQPLFDTLGYMARSIDDLQSMFALCAELPAAAPWDEGRRPRIALCRTHQWDHAEAESRFVLESVAAQLEGEGCDVEEWSLPDRYADLVRVHRAVLYHGIAKSLDEDYQVAGSRMSDSLQTIIQEGRALPVEAYEELREVVAESRAAINGEFGTFDAILCPSAPGEAPIGTATGSPIFQVAWTLLGVPCLNLPLGSGPNGMPVGVQLVGRRHEDGELLSLGASLVKRVISVQAPGQGRNVACRWPQCCGQGQVRLSPAERVC